MKPALVTFGNTSTATASLPGAFAAGSRACSLASIAFESRASFAAESPASANAGTKDAKAIAEIAT